LDNIERFGGDPKRVVISGHSAGAHLTGLVMLDPRWLGRYGHHPDEIAGFVGVSGVYDMDIQLVFAREHQGDPDFIVSVMDGKQRLREASPAEHIRPMPRPFLLIHGDEDKTVPLEMSLAFHHQLTLAGVPSEMKVYPRTTHSGVLFDALAQNPARLIVDLKNFVRRIGAV
jgi:dipeptidyl aminopeptidase/acylaminoacyl peptidase